MTITIELDVEKARKALSISAGSIEEYHITQQMNDKEIKDKILCHIKCWGITEKEN